MLWRKKITKEDHDDLKDQLKKIHLYLSSNAVTKKLAEAEKEFQEEAKQHGLNLEDLQTSIIGALIKLTDNLVEFSEIHDKFRTLLKELENNNGEK